MQGKAAGSEAAFCYGVESCAVTGGAGFGEFSTGLKIDRGSPAMLRPVA